MFHQLLAQQRRHRVDSRQPERERQGVEAQWPVYGRLGEYELRDLEDGITWLKQQPYVDASRIVLQRLELWRLHDGLCAHAQHELVGRGWSARR